MKKILVSNKICFGEKTINILLVICIISYVYNNDKVKSLRIMLPKTSAYRKSYDGQTKWMCFLIEDDDLY